MNKVEALLSLFLLLIVVSGCLGGDGGGEEISVAIGKWEKVVEKSNELNKMDDQFNIDWASENKILQEELQSHNPNFGLLYSILDNWEDRIEMMQGLVWEESLLISDFAGATVALKGEARVYGEEVLTNMREANRYETSALKNLDNSIGSLRSYLKSVENLNPDDILRMDAERNIEKADSDLQTAREHWVRANDAMHKLAALQ